MDDKIDYFVQITTCVQVPGGQAFRSYAGMMELDALCSEDERFWQVITKAEDNVTRYGGESLEYNNGAALIFYRAVPNE